MRRWVPILISSVLAACSYDVVTTAVPAPELASISPAQGRADQSQAVEIVGQNLLPLIAQDLSQPDGVRVDLDFAAWLGTVALQQVTYVDDEHLTATVPAGLAPGVYALKVETPHGLQASLADAYEVLPGIGPSISSVLPANLINDQDEILDVVGSGFDSSTLAELQPASGPAIALAVSNLNPAGFTATVARGTAAGIYALQVTTGGGQTVLEPDAVAVWNPAVLVASIGLSGSTAHTDEALTVTVTIRNDGGSEAQGVQVARPTTSGSGTVTHVSGPLPASANIAPGAAQDFTLTYTATGAGQVVFTTQASGTNIHSLRPVVSNQASSAALDILAGAALTATLSAPPAVLLDDTFDVTLTVQNTGQGQASAVTPAIAVSDAGSLGLEQGPAPASVDLDGGESHVFTYTYRATALGQMTLTADVSGTDVLNGTGIAAPTVTADVGIFEASALVAAWQTASATVRHGQSINVVLRVTNTGGARVTGVAPGTLQITGSTGTTCAAPTPASADFDGSASQDFSFACTVGSTSGAWSLIAGAQGTDSVTGQPAAALPVESAAFAAVGPAALTLAWQALPAQVATGQTFMAVLRVTNAGESGALGVAPTGFAISGATGTTCGDPAPASADLAAGASQDFTYDCTAGSTAGTAQLSAGATATAALGGGAITAAAVDSASVQVLAGAALDVISVSSPSTDVYQGQAGVQVSVLVENTGEIAANFTDVASWLVFGAGSVIVTAQYTVTPAGGNPTSVSGGAQATLQYTVTVSEAATPGTIVVDAVATGTDSVSGAAIQSGGATSSHSFNVIANTRPVACFTAPPVATTGVEFTLDASCSSDAEDALADLTVAWDLDGDGSYEVAASASSTRVHTIATPGIYTIGVAITDSAGATAYTPSLVVVADSASTLVVTTTANEFNGGETATPPHLGTGLSLREAITIANARAGRDTIRFDPTVFPTTGALISTTNTGLPDLSDNAGVQIIGHPGVRVSSNSNTSILDIQSDNNVIARLEFFGATNNGKYCLNTGSGDTNNWFFENHLHDCRTALQLGAGSSEVGPGNRIDAVNTGIRGSAGDDLHVHGNVLSGCGSRCIFIDAGANHVIERNLFYRAPGGAGAEAVQLEATASIFWHNTVHNFTGNGLDLRGLGHDVKNNVFTNNAAAAIADSSGLTAASNDYNACFDNGGTACGATAGSHIVTDDPLYVDAASGDFRLQAASPCVDAGTDLGLDVNGATPGLFNGAAPDLGARER